jgi:hypothetical protein
MFTDVLEERVASVFREEDSGCNLLKRNFKEMIYLLE